MTTENCKGKNELYLDIIQIYPFVSGELKHTIPFNVRKETVSVSELGVVDIATLLKGRTLFSAFDVYDDAGELLSCEIDSGVTVESVSDRTVSGISFKTTIVFNVPDGIIRSKSYTDKLQESTHEFILVSSEEEYMLLRCTDFAYKCTEKSTTESKQVTIEINNVNGIQFIKG